MFKYVIMIKEKSGKAIAPVTCYETSVENALLKCKDALGINQCDYCILSVEENYIFYSLGQDMRGVKDE